jgi:hypothetical protein
MNKLISIKQNEKTMDLFDENDNYCESIEESLFLDRSKSMKSIINKISDNNEEDSENKKKRKKLSKNKLSLSSSNFSGSQNSDEIACTNKKCLETNKEIEQLKLDCLEMEKKLSILVKTKSEEFIEISSKLTKVCKKIDDLQLSLEIYLDKELTGFEKYDYKTLANAESNLMKLLIKVKNKISNIEYGVINGNVELPEDESLKCSKCNKNQINCLLYPCEHMALCCDCVKSTVKCPICFKFIEYYDKVFLPNDKLKIYNLFKFPKKIKGIIINRIIKLKYNL